MSALRAVARLPNTREHPALASAQQAIRRALSRLTPHQVFQVAATVDMMLTGKDGSTWALSASYAADHPEKPYRWKCDERAVTKGKGGA